MIDVALAAMAVMVAVGMGTRYPLGVGGYVIITLLAYMTIATLYEMAASVGHLTPSRFSHHLGLFGWW
jgi:hypothetical protein